MKAQALFLAVALVLYGCDSKPPAKPPAQAASAENPAAPAPAAETTPAAVEHQVTGKITGLEDGPHPMYDLTITPAAGDPVYLSMNAEDVDLGGLQLGGLRGLNVTATYVSGEKPDLGDMRLDGRSVLGSDTPKKSDPAWKSITGKLEGAGGVSGGDLPDKVSVTDSGGRKVTFEIYINEEMVPANGKTVTAFYGFRQEDRATHLKKLNP